MAVTGYCLKDKKNVEIKDPQNITMKNGKPAITGTCPNCGTKIFKIGKSSYLRFGRFEKVRPPGGPFHFR